MLLRDPRGPRGGRWNASGPPPGQVPPGHIYVMLPKVTRRKR